MTRAAAESNMGKDLTHQLTRQPRAIMIAADASLSTIDTNSSARLAFGWQVLDKQFYAGPETQVYGAQGYAQWRFGIHVTSFRTGDAEWSAAGGWAIDSDNRSSPYLRLGFMQRE
ncbi:MAG: cellulose biosynthesis protein BcsS [Pseudolabrys sp.]